MTVIAEALLAAYSIWFVLDIAVAARSSPYLQPLPQGGAPRSPPALVSIIVPARNCERTIAACLGSLLGLDYPAKEVIVVEGHSTDGTMEALAPYAGSVKVVSEPPLPAGWIGKSWACHQGSLLARGDYLLFTDADTVHSPGSLTSAVGHAEAEGIDFLSLSPMAELRTLPERLFLPSAFMLMLSLAKRLKVNDDASRFAWGMGTYMLVSRDAYVLFEGHAATRGIIDEDVRLAMKVRERGLRVRTLDGSLLLRTSMYESASSLFGGLVRNIYGLARRSRRNATEILVAALVRFVLPFVALVGGLLFFATGHPWTVAALGGALAILADADYHVFVRKLGLGLRYVILLPLSSLFLLCVLVVAIGRAVVGANISWRGRVYASK